MGFVCPNASKIQSYCDSADPYCCTGNDPNVHQGYGPEYGQQALAFIKSKLSSTSSSGGSPTTTASTSTPTSGGGGSCSAMWGQCGGIGWTGPTCCSSGTCQKQWVSLALILMTVTSTVVTDGCDRNDYYSQCL